MNTDHAVAVAFQDVLDMVDALPEARVALSGIEADRVAYVEALNGVLISVGWTHEAYTASLCDAV